MESWLSYSVLSLKYFKCFSVYICRISELTGHSKNIIWPLGCLPLWSDSVNRASVELGDFKSGSGWQFLPPVIPAFKRAREKDHFWVQGQPKLGGPLQKEGTKIWVGMCLKRMLLYLAWTKNRSGEMEKPEKSSQKTGHARERLGTFKYCQGWGSWRDW